MMPMSAFSGIVVLMLSLVLAPAVHAQRDDYQDAAKLFQSGQHARSLVMVDGFLKANPKDARARFLKGLIYTEQGKPGEAMQIFTSLTEDFPELPEPYNNLAVLYAAQGQYDKARHALEMAISAHPSYATAHENLGDIYARMASQAYDKALQIDRSNSTAQKKLAMIKELFTGSPRAPTKAPAAKPGSSSTTGAVPVASR